MKQRILITGAGGFVGSYLIKELQKDPNNIIFASVNKITTSLKSLVDQDHILLGDLTDPRTTHAQFVTANPSVIYHLASISDVSRSFDSPLPLIQTNTAISFNVLTAYKEVCPTARFLSICSANVYGAVGSNIPIKETAPLRPLNPYAVSKINQEMLSLQFYLAYGLDIVIVRPFNHTGPGQIHDFVIPRLAFQVVEFEHGISPAVLKLGGSNSIRDFTDVRDMVCAYTQLAALGKSGEIYNIGSGIGTTILSLANTLRTLSHVRFEVVESSALNRSYDVPALVADTTKLRSLYPYLPAFSLERTISDILEYERNNYHEH